MNYIENLSHYLTRHMYNYFILKILGDVTQEVDKVALTLLSRFDGEFTVVKVFFGGKRKRRVSS